MRSDSDRISGQNTARSGDERRREEAVRPEADRPWRDRTFRLTVFRRAMVSVAAALVICALAEGFWRNHLYFVYAACASSALLMLRAWLVSLGYTRPRRVKTPEMLRGNRRPGRHKPAFRMTAEDFDDDLSALTLPDEESLPEAWQRYSGAAGYGLAGLLMLAFSFL